MRDWAKREADVVKIMNRHFTEGRGNSRIQHVVVHYNAAETGRSPRHAWTTGRISWPRCAGSTGWDDRSGA